MMRPKRPHAAFGHHHRPVSWTPSKIPYGGFSPVRLQATAFQRVPSDLSFEPSFADFGYAVLFLPCPSSHHQDFHPAGLGRYLGCT
jgi:hypothetical protein